MIDVFTKYAWIKPLKDKKAKTDLNIFIKVVSESNRTPYQLWVDQGREFYNSLMQKWWDNNDILIYSNHNKCKTFVAERFIRTLKAKIYKKMTANDRKSYLGYFNKFHTIILLIVLLTKKSVDANYSAMIKEIVIRVVKLLNLKLGLKSRLLGTNISSKGYTKNWSREIFVADSTLKTNPWTYKSKI